MEMKLLRTFHRGLLLMSCVMDMTMDSYTRFSWYGLLSILAIYISGLMGFLPTFVILIVYEPIARAKQPLADFDCKSRAPDSYSIYTSLMLLPLKTQITSRPIRDQVLSRIESSLLFTPAVEATFLVEILVFLTIACELAASGFNIINYRLYMVIWLEQIHAQLSISEDFLAHYYLLSTRNSISVHTSCHHWKVC